jgi:hypothetical protein
MTAKVVKASHRSSQKSLREDGRCIRHYAAGYDGCEGLRPRRKVPHLIGKSKLVRRPGLRLLVVSLKSEFKLSDMVLGNHDKGLARFSSHILEKVYK